MQRIGEAFIGRRVKWLVLGVWLVLGRFCFRSPGKLQSIENDDVVNYLPERRPNRRGCSSF